MARKKTKNKHLPSRVYLRSGTYYFVDYDKKWNNLGREYAKAMALFAGMVANDGPIVTVNDGLDRYLKEVAPLKAASSYQSDLKRSKELRKRYGAMRMDQVTTRAIYQVMDKRASQGHHVSANRELALLSHLFKKAIRWGAVDNNPCTGIERFKETPRDRYITDEEYTAFGQFAGPQIAAYMDFKLLTGLRQGDILELMRSDLKDDGIHVTVNKTQRKMIIGWTDHLRAAVDALVALQPKKIRSMYLLCTRRGAAYSSDGFRSIWQRKMKAAIEKGILKERFRDHDLRAKTGSDTDLEHASSLLAHLDRKTTERHYRRKPTKVTPLK